MKINLFTTIPEHVESSFKMLQEGLAGNKMAQGKIAFTWEKAGASPDGRFTGYICKFAYEHQNFLSDKILFSEFEKKMNQIHKLDMDKGIDAHVILKKIK